MAMKRLTCVLAALLSVTLGTATADRQVHGVAELNTEQIRALDPSRTAVILPGGILEQHGPYLPSYTDGYRNERIAASIAAAVAAKPGWAALIFPSVPLGTGGANEIGRKYSFPGTYAVRSTTLRSVFMDLATELRPNGVSPEIMYYSRRRGALSSARPENLCLDGHPGSERQPPELAGKRN